MDKPKHTRGPLREGDRRNRSRKRSQTWRDWEPANWEQRHCAALASPESGYIYVIDDGRDAIKVGLSRSHPRARLKQLQTGNPNRLTLAHYFQTSHLANAEMLIHAALKPWRTQGEWFTCPPSTALAAWRRVLKSWPRRDGSPQAWADAHRSLTVWGADRFASEPEVAKSRPLPHRPPLGPPITVRPKRQKRPARNAPRRGSINGKGNANGKRRASPRRRPPTDGRYII